MGRGPNKSKEERTIIAGSYIAGYRRVECNQMLAEKGYPEVKKGYWDMTSQYADIILDKNHPYSMADHVTNPRSLRDLKSMGNI